jgi:hypothetical protein
MPTYDQTQTVFALSMLSNLGSGIEGTVAEIESKAFTAINAELSSAEPAIGKWSVIWGPAVYQAPNSKIADNVMVVFQAGAGSSIPGQIVAGIAGTNPYSAFDWVFEDFLVIVSTPWETGNPGNLKPRISLGTAIGLSILKALVPGPGLPGASNTLNNFLDSTLTAPALLTISGHSLGGALSPAMALYLSDTKAAWDPSGFATLACLPSAGPTSGNGDFASYYDAVLGNVTARVHNRLDVVPHGWESDDLVELPTIYSPNIPATLELYSLLVAALAISASVGYTQIDTSTRLNGSINTQLIDPSKSDCDNYIAQMNYQHVQAYFDLLGVGVSPRMSTLFAQASAQALPKMRLNLTRRQMMRQRAKTAPA